MIPEILDLFLISPFRWPASALLGMWLGCFFIAIYCVFLGELTISALFLANKNYYAGMQKKMVDAHNKSVDALHCGDKPAYQAINSMANEYFGKFFFAQGALGTSSLWPVPFALAWLSQRFEGIPIIKNAPWGMHISYPFVFISTYILSRIFLGKYVRRLPFLSTMHKKRREAQKACGRLKSYFKSNEDFDL